MYDSFGIQTSVSPSPRQSYLPRQYFHSPLPLERGDGEFPNPRMMLGEGNHRKTVGHPIFFHYEGKFCFLKFNCGGGAMRSFKILLLT